MLNSSMDMGIFPVECKLGKVTPLPKDGDLANVSNWRPVS